MKSSINSAIIKYTPKLPINSQNILYYVFSSITREDYELSRENKSSLKINVSKIALYNAIWLDIKHWRRDFYAAKKRLHELLEIDTEDLKAETSIISWTIESKRIDNILFEIPYCLLFFQPDYQKWNFFSPTILELSKLTKRYSHTLYQIIKANIYKWKMDLTPREFNDIFETNLNPWKILQVIKQARKDFADNNIDIDFTIQPNKIKNKTVSFSIVFIKTNKTLEDYSSDLIKEAHETYKGILNYFWKWKAIFIKNKLEKLNDFQVNYVFDKFYRGREQLDKSIIDKILFSLDEDKSKVENISFKKTIIQSVNLVPYSKISKKIDFCTIEIKKWKINNKPAFVISKINELIKGYL